MSTIPVTVSMPIQLFGTALDLAFGFAGLGGDVDPTGAQDRNELVQAGWYLSQDRGSAMHVHLFTEDVCIGPINPSTCANGGKLTPFDLSNPMEQAGDLISFRVIAAAPGYYANVDVTDETRSPNVVTDILLPISGYQQQYQGSAEAILELDGYDLSQPKPYPRCVVEPITDNCQYPTIGPQTFENWQAIPPNGTQDVRGDTLNYRERNIISERNGSHAPIITISDPMPIQIVSGFPECFSGPCDKWTDAAVNAGEDLSGTGTDLLPKNSTR